MDQQAIIATLNGVLTATIGTILLKRGLRNVWLFGLRVLQEGQPRLVEPPFALRFTPALEDLATPDGWSPPRSTRAAIADMARQCIVVAGAMSVLDAGIFGDILCARLAKRAIAGLMTDGFVRDIVGVRAIGLPIWS